MNSSIVEIEITKNADILVVAVGKKHLVTGDMIKEGAVVIDVGINKTVDGLCGDFNPPEQDNYCDYTTVPGGVGLLTRKLATHMIYDLDTKKGQKLAILSESKPEYGACVFASTMAGFVTVPLDIKLTKYELKRPSIFSRFFKYFFCRFPYCRMDSFPDNIFNRTNCRPCFHVSVHALPSTSYICVGLPKASRYTAL